MRLFDSDSALNTIHQRQAVSLESGMWRVIPHSLLNELKIAGPIGKIKVDLARSASIHTGRASVCVFNRQVLLALRGRGPSVCAYPFFSSFFSEQDNGSEL